MSNDQKTEAKSPSPGTGTVRVSPSTVLVALSAVVLLVSLAGSAWVYSPANPAAKVPATTLSFSDLKAVVGSGQIPTTGVQEAYFGWLAWVLVIAVIAFGVAEAMLRNRAIGATIAVIGTLAFVLTVFALKGELTWSQFWDGHSNLRLGGYLVFGGCLMTIVAGALSMRRRD